MKKYALLLAALSLAAFAPAQKGYLLRLRLKQNEVVKYDMAVTSMGMNIDMGMKLTCTKVAGHQYTLVTTMGSMTMNGKPVPAQQAEQIKKMVVTTVVDDQGRTLSTKTTGVPGMGPDSQSTTVPFPAGPVTVGKTWTGTNKVNNMSINTTYKFVGVKSVGGVQCAMIESTPNGIPGMKLDKPILTAVDLSKGIPIQLIMSATVGQGAQTGKMTITMKKV